MKNDLDSNYFEKAKDVLENARIQVVQSVNYAMVSAYYQIGKIIIEEEQEGKSRAEYSEKTIKELSLKLKKRIWKRLFN